MNWEIGGFDRTSAVDFCRQGINPLVSVLLTSRGVTSIEGIRAILDDDPSGIHDPFLMTDMDRAVSRINTAIENNERIAIYGDYDVDGMTSCALIALWLRSKGLEYETYIPGRFGEGYGLNSTALESLKSRGVGLVITVDCGITAIEEAEYARSIGLGLVITDHHECREELPEADAVIDPKRPDCAYPNKALAGVGVAFKLVCALEGVTDCSEMIDRYGDLVAIGTIADIMPVLGENRELIRRGLQVFNNGSRPGLLRLLHEVGVEPGKLNGSTVGFTIAPRLNAAGRMGRPELSVDLLLTDSAADADTLTVELCRLNAERRILETEIFEEAVAMLPDTLQDEPVVLACRGWFQGVTGIVAAKIAERYQIPAIIISIDEDGVGRGSCRSYGSFGIYDALRCCEDILSSYGGHEMAAGVTVAEGDIDELRTRIVSLFRESVEVSPKSGLFLDFEVEKLELLSVDNVAALESLEPFGNGNPSPCLCIMNATLAAIYPIGAGKHTRLRVEKAGKSMDCVFFSMPPEELHIREGMLVDLAFEPQMNEYRGRSNVQLNLIDIRMSE